MAGASTVIGRARGKTLIEPAAIIRGVIWTFLSLAAVLLTVGLALWLGMVWLLARALVRPPRMTDGKAAYVLRRLSPGDLGLSFQDVSFDVRDAATGGGQVLRIAAWWIPHPGARGRCAVLLHGYADAKVGSIAWAPTWHALGWNVLAIDLRAHGESGGEFCTGGFFERHDVNQVINSARAQWPDDTRQVVLFGVSFGAAVAVAAAVERTDVDAVVLDSPVPDFAEGAAVHMGRLGAPGGAVRGMAVRLAEGTTGARFGDVRMLDLVPKLACPVMIVAPSDDVLLPEAVVERLRETARVTVWRVENADHLMVLPADPDEYRRRLREFLDSIGTVSAEAPVETR